MNERPGCAHCGEALGVYEPLRLWLRDGSLRLGSWLTLRDQILAPGSVVVHERCGEALERSCGESARRWRSR